MENLTFTQFTLDVKYIGDSGSEQDQSTQVFTSDAKVTWLYKPAHAHPKSGLEIDVFLLILRSMSEQNNLLWGFTLQMASTEFWSSNWKIHTPVDTIEILLVHNSVNAPRVTCNSQKYTLPYRIHYTPQSA
jgi:hypothetical protein